ncbi:hypothetical protein D3C86_1846350 [compost metagenome]
MEMKESDARKSVCLKAFSIKSTESSGANIFSSKTASDLSILDLILKSKSGLILILLISIRLKAKLNSSFGLTNLLLLSYRI